MITRRQALIGTAGLSGAALLGGCNTVTRSTDIAAINAPAQLPTYRRFAGPPADLPLGDDRMPLAYRRYPSERPSVVSSAPGDGSRISGSVPTSSPIPPTVDRNSYWQELDRALNSPLQLSITPAGDWGNKFATSVAGDTLGDVFNVDGNFSYLPQFMEAKAQNLNEFLGGDAILDYPFLANIPTESWEGCVFSGGIYAIPVPRGILASNVLYAREDLFAERGVDPSFTSVDELLARAREMTDERANRWAFTNVPVQVLQRMVGLKQAWTEQGGRFVFASEAEEHKQALDLGARLIKEGLVHPDSTSSSQADFKLWFNEGSGAMVPDSYTATPGFYQQNVAGEKFRIAMPVIPGPDGKPSGMWLAFPNNSITSLAQGSPDRIRMLLRVMDWCAAPFGTAEYLFRKFGTEGEHFTFTDGDPVLTPKGNSEAALGAFPIQYFTDCPMPLYYSGHPEGVDVVRDNLLASLPDATQDASYGLYSPTQSKLKKILDGQLNDATTQILLGRRPVASWDDTIAEWRRSGGDAIRAELQQAQSIKRG